MVSRQVFNIEEVNSHNPFTPYRSGQLVKCCHCGSTFMIDNSKIGESTSLLTGEVNTLIFCTNDPECDGTLIDFMSVGADAS